MWDTTTLKKTFKLTKLFKEFNEKYFGNSLGECKFEAVPDPSTTCPAAATIRPRKKRTGGNTALIKFNSRIDWNDEDIRSVLLHEMIHYYIYVKIGPGILFPHGVPFIWEMLRINIRHNEHITRYWRKERLTWSDGRPR